MKFKQLVALAFVLTFGVLLILGLSQLDGFTPYQDADLSDRISQEYVSEDSFALDNALNRVTAIVVDFRSFDTLGEVTVLFISSLGVALLLGASQKNHMKLDFKPNFMLKTGSRFIVSIMLITGLMIIVHGHLTPGGGFPGGAMIASSLLLLYLSDDEFRAQMKRFKVLESISGILYVTVGLVGLFVAQVFLANFLDQGVLGDLISGGIIPIVYVLIGLKVGSEITGIIDEFLTEEAK